MAAGRPVGSRIQQHIVEILFVMGTGYGNAIHKVYCVLYAPVSLRSIHYQLRNGLGTGVFEVAEVVAEQGTFSWGGVTEKVYYRLGKSARPVGDPLVRGFFEGSDKPLEKANE